MNEVGRFELAVKLNDFYKNFDYYDYMDSLNGAGTEEALVEGLVEQFGDPKAVDAMIEFLEDIKENGEPDAEQTRVLDELIEEVGKIRGCSAGSLDVRLGEAKEKSALLHNADRDICKEIGMD